MNEAWKAPPLELLFATASSVERPSISGTVEEEVTALFEHFRTRLLRYLFSLGLSLQDGEEVVQEVFLSLFRHLQSEKSRHNLRGWIFRVAHNQGLKRRREAGSGSVLLDSAFSHLQDPGPSPEEQVFFQQRQKRLLAVLNALPDQDRHCLYLRAEGLPYREIAQVLDISLGGVSQSLARAIRRLSDADYR